jgi:hypothetical protein
MILPGNIFDPFEEVRLMDATRARRSKDPVRRWWYGLHRQRRFARRLGFAPPEIAQIKNPLLVKA